MVESNLNLNNTRSDICNNLGGSTQIQLDVFVTVDACTAGLKRNNFLWIITFMYFDCVLASFLFIVWCNNKTLCHLYRIKLVSDYYQIARRTGAIQAACNVHGAPVILLCIGKMQYLQILPFGFALQYIRITCKINPLSPYDALKHHYTSLWTDLIFPKLGF